MIISKNITNFKTLNRFLQKTQKVGDISSLKLFNKSNLKKSSTVALPLFLIGCNNTTVTEDICENYNAGTNIICLDDEITGPTTGSHTTTIEMPSKPIPVSGTSTADTFIANSGFLTSKTIIDGGDGTDTLNLNLKNSVKNGPTI